MDTGFIQKINAIYEKLGVIDTANNSFNKEVIDVLVELKNLDLELIAQDIDKGTFLGNRKIDINLALNMQGVTKELIRDNPDLAETIWTDSTKTVRYDSAIALFKDGAEITIPFIFDGNPTSISTHSDLLLQFDNSVAFKGKLDFTSINAFPSIVVGEELRFYDVSGQSSNLERITLNAVAGAYIEKNPTFYWAKSTSAVETLSMRGGDIIKLGNEIDNILALVNKISEVIAIQSKLPELIGEVGETTIYNKLTELQAIYDNLLGIVEVYNNIANINNVASNKANIDKVSSQELTLQEVINNLTAIQSASANADSAEDSKNLALQYVEQMTGLTVNIITLASGQSATQSYNSATNTLTLGIPQGLKGDRGDAFKIDARGNLDGRVAYDGAATGFSYLSTDTNPTYVYFKKSDAVGDWTDGIAFGKGDKGDRGYGIADISKTSTVGNVDTYTITIEDGTTYTFTVTNSDVSSVNGKTGTVVLTKADVGLDKVNNTSDANKPISIAQQEALDNKADKEDTYTKTEIDTELATKADDAEVVKLTSEQNITGKKNFDEITVKKISYASDPDIYKLGQPGEIGFGVATAKKESYAKAGLVPLYGHDVITHENYGNYLHVTSGAIVVHVPKHYLKITSNIFEYKEEATAGYVLDRTFINGGVEKTGIFISKFGGTNNNGVFSSQQNQDPLSTGLDHNPISNLNNTPSNTYGGLYSAVKTMDSSAFLTPIYAYMMLARIAKAHGQASVSTEVCAYIDVDPKMPKGCLASSLSDVNDTSVKYASSGYSSCGRTGSAVPFAKTTHNGQACGIADLNGNMWEVASGFIRTDANGFLMLKESVDITTIANDDATQASGGAYDINLYDVVDLSDVVNANDGWTYFGNGTNQVFAMSTDRNSNAYRKTMLGIPNSTGHSAAGTTEFGNDGLYRYLRNEMACIVGGYWGYSSDAGAFCMYLILGRTDSNSTVGGRASLYGL